MNTHLDTNGLRATRSFQSVHYCTHCSLSIQRPPWIVGCQHDMGNEGEKHFHRHAREDGLFDKDNGQRSR
jgi:hypothetical protein